MLWGVTRITVVNFYFGFSGAVSRRRALYLLLFNSRLGSVLISFLFEGILKEFLLHLRLLLVRLLVGLIEADLELLLLLLCGGSGQNLGWWGVLLFILRFWNRNRM